MLWQVATFCCEKWQNSFVTGGNILLWKVATFFCDRWQHSVV